MKSGSSRAVRAALFAAACAALILPLWIFNVQTQDGPVHLYNAMLIRDYHAPDALMLRRFFVPAMDVPTNWTVDLLSFVLLHFLPPQVCNSILVTLCAGILPLSLAYLMRAAGRGRSPFVIACLIFSYNWSLFIGFYNFTLSIALYFFALGYWFKRRDRMNGHNWAVLSAGMCVIYVTHVFALAALLLSLALGMVLLGRAHYTRKPFVQAARYFAPLILPALLVAAYQIHQPTHHYIYRSFGLILLLLRDVQPLVYYGRGEHIAAYAFWIAVAAGIAASLYARAAQRPRFEPTDYFAVLSLCFFVLSFAFPSLATDSRWNVGFLNERALFVAFLSMLPWFEGERLPPKVREVLATFLLAVFALHSVATWVEFRRTEPELKELLSGIPLVQAHSTFDYGVPGEVAWSRLVMPLNKALLYYAMDRRDIAWITPHNNKFPHHFKRVGTAVRPKYIAIWSSTDPHAVNRGGELARSLNNYQLIRRNEVLKLFRRIDAPGVSS